MKMPGFGKARGKQLVRRYVLHMRLAISSIQANSNLQHLAYTTTFSAAARSSRIRPFCLAGMFALWAVGHAMRAVGDMKRAKLYGPFSGFRVCFLKSGFAVWMSNVRTPYR